MISRQVQITILTGTVVAAVVCLAGFWTFGLAQDRLLKTYASFTGNSRSEGDSAPAAQKLVPASQQAMVVTNAENWTAPTFPRHLSQVDQFNSDLIREIRQSWLIPPDAQPLNLHSPSDTYFAQHQQDSLLDEIFNNKTGGFYVECGAFEGERLSNSLYFERQRHWKGLLVEASPAIFNTLASKHRNAYLLNACLSPTNQTATLDFVTRPGRPFLSSLGSSGHDWSDSGDGDAKHESIQCFPFFSILAALGNPRVDFFSLDVEGAEMDVLKTIPLDKVDIDIFVIEVGHRDRPEKVAQFTKYLAQYGYSPIELKTDPIDLALRKNVYM